MARRYSELDPAVHYEDLIQSGYLAVRKAILSYQNGSKLRFTSHLWWHLQKEYQSLLGNDKIVEITYRDGRKEVISYQNFLRRKNGLSEVESYRVLSLLTSLEEERGKLEFEVEMG